MTIYSGEEDLKRFSTIHGSVRADKWVKATHLMCASKKGISDKRLLYKQPH